MEVLRSQYTAVQDVFEDFINNLTSVQDTAQDTLLKLKQRQAVAEANLAECTQTAEHKKISLDIGGTVFNTTESTLLQHKDTFFWAMLRSGQFEPDPKTGQYFIDRSPQMFGVILDYLRDGKLWTADRFTHGERAMLQNELDFYQIPVPQPTVRWEPNDSMGFIFSGGNTTATHKGDQLSVAYTTKVLPLTHFTLCVEHKGGKFDAKFLVATHADGLLACNLQSGRVEQLFGEPGTPVFPELQFPATGVVYRYQFCWHKETCEMKMTWPTGQVHKWKGDNMEKLLVAAACGSADFTIESP